MTDKQKRLAEIMAANENNAKTQKQMMIEAGYSPRTKNAKTYMENPKVSKRSEELSKPTIKRLKMSVTRRVEMLTEIAEGLDNLPADRMKAIDMLNKMDGTYNKQADKFRERELALKEKEFELKKELELKKMSEEW